MKVLVLSNYYPEHIGGIEKVAQNLVQQFRTAGHTTRWIACDVPPTWHVPDQDDRPLRAWNITERKFGFPLPIPYLQDLHHILDNVRWSDIVHIHDCLYPAHIVAFLCAKLLRKPVLISQHVALVPYAQVYKQTLQQVVYRTWGKMSLGLADQVVFISDTVQSWFQQFVRFRRPAQLIPNGVDIHIFSYVSSDEQDTLRQTLNLPVDRPVILYVGRFVEKKGIRLLRDVVRHTSSWHWVMIGRPGDEDPAMWGFDHITVLPPKSQRELRSYYGAADIVVLPSIGEGFPLVAQEAMACGTPVLLAEETARAIPQAQHLFVTTSPDAPTLHTRLATALSNPDALRELGYQACIFVQQNWNWVTVAHQYCYFFETLLKSNASVRQPVE